MYESQWEAMTDTRKFEELAIDERYNWVAEKERLTTIRATHDLGPHENIGY